MYAYYLEHNGRHYGIAEGASVELWARPKIGNPLLMHYAVVLRQGTLGMKDLVVDLQDRIGVRIVPVEAEAARHWTLMRHLDPDASLRAIQNLLALAPQSPQWTVGYNCEDFANQVADGAPKSHQREFLTVIGLLGLAAWWNEREQRRKRDARRRTRARLARRTSARRR